MRLILKIIGLTESYLGVGFSHLTQMLATVVWFLNCKHLKTMYLYSFTSELCVVLKYENFNIIH